MNRKSLKRAVGAILACAMVFGSSDFSGLGSVFARGGEVSVVPISFTGYSTLGDTITVTGGPENAEYVWTAYTDTYTSTNKVERESQILSETGNSVTTGDSLDEHFITCTVKGDTNGETYGTASLYVSSLPVMYITSEDFDYEDYRTEYNKTGTKTGHDVTINLTGNSIYTKPKTFYSGAAELKVRGNSTAGRPKTPFKLKLDKKTDLLGLGDGVKSKHWVLLANDIDHSLLRNKLLYDFSGEIGTEFFFQSTNVTMIYNGEYQGVYQLCEQRRIDEGRIDITDWVSVGEDAAESVANYEANNNEAVWKNTGYYASLASYQADASEEDNKLNAASALEDAINEKMYSDYSWIDEKKVTYDSGTGSVTFDFTDEKYGIGAFPATTGGYLVEMDFYNIDSNTVASLATNYLQPLYFSSPEPGEDAQDQVAAVESFKNTSLYKGALDLTQSFEYAIHSNDFVFRNSDSKKKVTNTGKYDWNWNGTSTGWASSTGSTTFTSDTYDGKHYSQIFDMDSLVNNFIFVEYAMNWDSMKNSFFFYKDVDGLAKIGPQWDFDWCWGNINMYNIDTNQPTTWHTTNEYFTNEQAYQSYQWNRLLVKDPYFLVKIYEKYQEVRPIIEDMIKEDGLIDQYYEYLKNAGAANDRRWSYTYNKEYGQDLGGQPVVSENFEQSITSIKTFLNTRVNWLDKQFASVNLLINSLGYYKKANDISEPSLTKKGDTLYLKASVSNKSCTGVVFQVNGTTEVEGDVEDGVARASLPLSVLNTDDSLNVVTAFEKGSNGYLLNTALKPSGNFEYITKSNFTSFKTSQVGLVPNMTIQAESSELYVSINANTKVNATGTSSDGSSVDLRYTSSNPKVATVANDGTITGLSAGSCTITVSAKDDLSVQATVTVYVRIASPKIKLVSASNKVKICWEKVEDAEKYQVYRSKKGGTYSLYKTVSDTSFTDKKVSKDTQYSYYVLALSSDSHLTSDKSNTIKALVPKKVSKLKGKAGKKRASVSFKKNKKASGYEVYISTKKKSGYKKKATLKKAKTTIKKLTSKTTYYVKVRAYYKSNGKKIYGSYSKVVKVRVK